MSTLQTNEAKLKKNIDEILTGLDNLSTDK